jgi:hypothetical protein
MSVVWRLWRTAACGHKGELTGWKMFSAKQHFETHRPKGATQVSPYPVECPISGSLDPHLSVRNGRLAAADRAEMVVFHSDKLAKPLICNSVNKARIVGMGIENIWVAKDS